jgi:hypothetical protein
MDFTQMDITTITHSLRGDGVRYLQLFLQEYTSIFNETVNPGCSLCLTTYLARYKNHFNTMENPNTSYRLHAKYENIPLEFGSPILVNNSNLTDEYAQKLLSHKNGERYFSHIPPQKETVQSEPTSTVSRKQRKPVNPKNQS